MTRDEKGRFKKGQTGNPAGRPSREVERRYLEVMKSATTEQDWFEITQRAIKDAKRGDAQARKWLSDYLIGLPRQGIDIEATVNAPGLEDVLKMVYGQRPA